MSISVLSNIPALNARRHLEESSQKFSDAVERISSGKRVNRVGDDAAGLAIGFTIESKIRGLQQGKRNAQDALSLMQVAEGGMNEVGNLLVRLRELAIQAASDNVSDKEREMVELESVQIKDEINRLAESTRYFDTTLLNGSGKDFTFQIGAENHESNRLHFSSSSLDLRASTLGISGISMSDSDSAKDSLGNIDEALTKINQPRASVGALQSRLQSISNNLTTYEENLSAAKSRIMDADIAKETANLVQASVLQKAGLAVLTQANMAPAAVLKLLE